MRRFGKLDANQKRIADRLRLEGWSVASTASLGNGFPDVLVGAEGHNVLLEIKNGDLSPSRRTLTPGEVDFVRRWHGQVAVVENEEQALAVVLDFIRRPRER